MESRKIPNEAINTAAEWWTKRISGKVKHDNGDNSFGSIFAGLMADDIAKPIPNGKLQKFKNNLLMRLSVLSGQGRTSIWLECDYGPCMMLAAAASDSDIPKENFPWKVSMRINPDAVEVKDGYGMPWVKIWPVADNNNEKEGAA
jgi:hypothetical protein